MSHHKPRKQSIADKPTARPKTETVNVAAAIVAGAVDTVQRIMDPLSTMFKRKQITERDYMAGDRYRMAYETIYGATGGASDYSRSRGGGLPGQPPAPPYMVASEIVSEAKRYLYPKDWAVVYRICIKGMTIRETSQQLYQHSPTRGQEEDCGRRLREGLSRLADLWFPVRTGSGDRTRSEIHERPIASESTLVPKQSGVVHATKDRIYRSG